MILNKSNYFILFFLFTGCVEHIFFIDKLPKTPTEKIAKDLLKKSYGS